MALAKEKLELGGAALPWFEVVAKMEVFKFINILKFCKISKKNQIYSRGPLIENIQKKFFN